MTAPTTPENGFMAFWSYDNFPHVLGGTVERVLDSGAVITREYGPGYAFRPLAILPLVAGAKVKEQLEALRAEHRQASERLRREFTDKLIEAAPFMKEHLR